MKELKHNCNLCIDKNKYIWECVAKSRLAQIDLYKTPHKYTRGQIIFHEGNPAFALYCISLGTVKIYKTLQSGEIRVIRLIREGEIFGYRALLANEPYAATAEAVEPSIICTIPKPVFIKVLRNSPDLALKLLAKLSTELRISEEQLISLHEFSGKQRTAHLLISLLSYNKKTNSIITNKLLRYEMAQMIGIRQETLSRILKNFVNQGIIEMNRSSITVIDIDKLIKYSKGQNI